MFGISAHSSGALERGLERILQLPPDTVSIGPRQKTQSQVFGEWEASSLSAQDSFPPHLGTACVSNRVQVKRGVAISWDTAEVLEPPSKKTRGEESALPEGAPQTSSPLGAQEHLRDSLSGLQSKAPQGTGQAGSAGEPSAQEEDSRAETPEGLLGVDSTLSSQVIHHVVSSLKRKNREEDEAEKEAYVEEKKPYVVEEEPYVVEEEPYVVEEEPYVVEEEPYVVEEEPYVVEEEPYVVEEEPYVVEEESYVVEEEAYVVEEEAYVVEEEAYVVEEELYVVEQEPYVAEEEVYVVEEEPYVEVHVEEGAYVEVYVEEGAHVEVYVQEEAHVEVYVQEEAMWRESRRRG
ncbi:Zonadhesin [Manis javanica]|nr:Zonadhesin [Manis javanica]